MEPFEGDLSTRGRLTSLKNKPQPNNLGKFHQHQCLPELLVNVYSYYLMVQVCLAVVCVEGGFSQIQSHLVIVVLGKIIVF